MIFTKELDVVLSLGVEALTSAVSLSSLGSSIFALSAWLSLTETPFLLHELKAGKLRTLPEPCFSILLHLLADDLWLHNCIDHWEMKARWHPIYHSAPPPTRFFDLSRTELCSNWEHASSLVSRLCLCPAYDPHVRPDSHTGV